MIDRLPEVTERLEVNRDDLLNMDTEELFLESEDELDEEGLGEAKDLTIAQNEVKLG